MLWTEKTNGRGIRTKVLRWETMISKNDYGERIMKGHALQMNDHACIRWYFY